MSGTKLAGRTQMKSIYVGKKTPPRPVNGHLSKRSISSNGHRRLPNMKYPLLHPGRRARVVHPPFTVTSWLASPRYFFWWWETFTAVVGGLFHWPDYLSLCLRGCDELDDEATWAADPERAWEWLYNGVVRWGRVVSHGNLPRIRYSLDKHKRMAIYLKQPPPSTGRASYHRQTRTHVRLSLRPAWQPLPLTFMNNNSPVLSAKTRYTATVEPQIREK